MVAFEKVVELKTLHAAADHLRISQAAMTKRIQSLERDLKVTLFLRSRRGMSLTEEGKALLQYCKSTHEAEGHFLSQISGSRSQEISLRIVGPTSAISSRVARDCEPLYAKYPFLRLHLKSDDHSNLIEVVRRGEGDLVIVSPQQVPLEMESKILRPDRYLLVASKKWKSRDLQDVIENERIIDFYESDETTTKYLKKFRLDKHARKSRLYINENEALVRMFISGVGYGTLTESVAEPHLKSGALVALNREQVLEDPLALAWYGRSREMSYFDDLIRSIK